LTYFQPSVSGKVHQDFPGKLKTVRLWSAAVYGGQVRYASKKQWIWFSFWAKFL